MQNKHEGPGTGPDSTRVTSQGRVFRVDAFIKKAVHLKSLAENGTLIGDTLKLPNGDVRLYPYDIIKYDNGQVSVTHPSDV